jgi:hypothetical protein
MCLIGKAAGMFEVTLFGAAFAGILSFVSPCVLPIVPFYISYLASVGLGDLKEGTEISKNVQRRAILSSLFFCQRHGHDFRGDGSDSKRIWPSSSRMVWSSTLVCGSVDYFDGPTFSRTFENQRP